MFVVKECNKKGNYFPNSKIRLTTLKICFVGEHVDREIYPILFMWTM